MLREPDGAGAPLSHPGLQGKIPNDILLAFLIRSKGCPFNLDQSADF